MRILVAVVMAFMALPAAARPFVATEADFQCLTQWATLPGHKTRIFNENPKRLQRALAVLGRSKRGLRYPVGTILELVPPIHVGGQTFFGEAMVKRGGAFNRAGDGWEFFVLNDRSDGSTEIVERGGAEVANSAIKAPTCQSCHIAGKKFDLVCETTHGCAPLPLANVLTPATIAFLQSHDPRCP
jgi:hypothetical protein